MVGNLSSLDILLTPWPFLQPLYSDKNTINYTLSNDIWSKPCVLSVTKDTSNNSLRAMNPLNPTNFRSFYPRFANWRFHELGSNKDVLLGVTSLCYGPFFAHGREIGLGSILAP